MSWPPPPPMPEPQRQRPAAVIGLLVGLIVFSLVAASFAAWKVLSSDDDTLGGGSSSAPPPSPRPTQPMPTIDNSLARYYDQKLRWHDCDGNRCATLKVPLDYTQPAGREIGIAVLKVPASDRKERIGSLVVNPGGPGAPGTSFAAGGSRQFGDALTTYYDIVGFDPRGVGASAPVRCVSTAKLDEILAFDPDPDTAAERQQSDENLREFGQGCLDKSGELARHISTKEAARDMDILRAALGESKLDYLGSSYGTFLGATYAEQFPTHVGRFVLDGAVDPSLSTEQLSLQQSKGFETALRAYVADCVDGGSCPLGNTLDEGIRTIQKFLERLDSHPIPTGTDRQLTEGLGTIGIWLPLYVKELWTTLTQALRSALSDNDGFGLLQLADLYTDRSADGFDTNSMEALNAVNCLDHDDYIPTSQVPAHFAEFEKASPTFGRAFAFSLSACSNWPIRSGERTVALHAPGAPPIVVIGTTRDPATPLIWAQALAEQLSSGQLITRDGDGHTGFQQGNSCVDDAVEKWLISGKVPKPDLKC